MKKSNVKGGQGLQINVTTQRNVIPAINNIGFSPIKKVCSTEITREEIKAITRDGQDLLYCALVHVALTRGIWILKEA